MAILKQDFKALTVEEITHQIGQANTRYYALVSTLLYELRSRFESDTLFGQHLKTTIPQWSGRFSSTQRARLINLGQFINDDLIEDIDNIKLGVTCLYDIAQNYDKENAKKNYLENQDIADGILNIFKANDIGKKQAEIILDALHYHVLSL